MNEITRRCLYLSREDKQRLIRVLTESLEEEEKEDDGSRFATLYKAATEICGHGILTRSRDFNLVMGRRMIAYKMRKEGYSLLTIGKKLIRHHASIIHMIRMMEEVFEYQNCFQLEMAYWGEFNKKITEYETNRESNQGS